MATQNLNLNTTNAVEQLFLVNQQLAAMNKKTEDIEKTTKEASSKMQKAWTEVKAKYDLFKQGIQDGISVLTKFKDTITSMESIQTQQTALTLLSKQGKDLNETLNRTLEITKGVASGFDILPVVNKLLVNGFDLTSESLEKLIDVSGIYSSVTGDSMRSVMEMLARAGQKESQAVLEKIGVYVNIDNELKKYAKTIGTTVEMMTEQEKQTQVMIISTEAMKEKFDELGLSATSLESPITHMFNKAEESAKTFTNEIVRIGATWYVESINWTSKAMEKYEEFSERLSAFVAFGFEGRDRVAKKWADKRYWEQQEELKKEIQANEKAEVIKTDTFIAYSEQQRAYGIQNNELIYKNYQLLMLKLQAEQGKTVFISSKLFDIDPNKDVRNLAKAINFTVEEVDAANKKLSDIGDKRKQKEMKGMIEAERLRDKINKSKWARLQKQYEEEKQFMIDAVEFNKKMVQENSVDVADLFEPSDEMKKMQKEKQDADEKLIKQDKETKDMLLKEQEMYENQKIKLQEMGVNAAADFTAMLINDVLMGEKEFRASMIADFVKGIGIQMVTDGTFHIFAGLAKAWGGNPLGWKESKAGVVEAAVGAGLAGGSAPFASSSGGGETSRKETASADRQKTSSKNTDTMGVYLYPDEKYWLRALNKGNKKIGGK